MATKSDSRRALAFPPHFSLWGAFQLPDDALPGLKSDVERIAQTTEPFSFTLTRYGFYPWRVMYLDVEKSAEVRRLHQRVKHTVEHYRTSWIPPSLRENTHWSPAQKSSVEKYGYQFAGRYFSPHVTIAGNDISQATFDQLKNELSDRVEQIPMTVSAIALIDIADHNRLIHRYSLS